MIVQNLYKKIFLWGYCLLPLLAACVNQIKEDEQAHIDKDLRELFVLESNYQEQLAKEGSSQALKENFQRDIELVRANFHAAVQLEGVEMHDDHEHLELDGDMLLPLNSFRGALEMWLLEQEAHGVAREESQRQINWLNSQFFKGRALYFNSSGIYWLRQGGEYTIPYRFHNDVDNHDRGLTKEAMTVWEVASSHTIQFEEKQSSDAVLISTPNITEQLVLGSATVGYRAQGNGRVQVYASNIRKLTTEEKGPLFVGYDKAFKATMMHELGHTLGLLHEHQRWDSHNYVRPSMQTNANDNNYGNYAFFLLREISWFSYQLSGETVQIPQMTGLKPQTCTPTDYDYASIMHYSGFTVLQNYQGYSRWEKTRFNQDLSDGDKSAIKLLYPRDKRPACARRGEFLIDID